MSYKGALISNKRINSKIGRLVILIDENSKAKLTHVMKLAAFSMYEIHFLQESCHENILKTTLKALQPIAVITYVPWKHHFLYEMDGNMITKLANKGCVPKIIPHHKVIMFSVISFKDFNPSIEVSKDSILKAVTHMMDLYRQNSMCLTSAELYSAIKAL